jgi:signal transduction histidine kinase
MQLIDEKTDSLMFLLVFGSLGAAMAVVLLQNLADPWMLLMLCCLLAVSFSLRNILLYPSVRHRNLGGITFLADVFLIFMIYRYDNSGSSVIFYYILIADITIAYTGIYSILAVAACMVSYLAVKFGGWTFPRLAGFAGDMLFQSILFLAFYVIMHLVKHQIRQKSRLQEAMFALKMKSKQLENAYVKLKNAAEELEEMTILKERNRIAREIHDTVGHTLTTVLVEMEAGEQLIRIDPRLASEKLGLAKGQVRKGLNDIRESVKTLQSGLELMGFIPSLKLLMEETTRHGNVFIRHEISQLPALSENQEKMLYRALQEGLTNGIRHGNSTAFVFQLKYENNSIRFFLQDNGKGCKQLEKGFGLLTMEERVREQGGILQLESGSGEGFSITIILPVACGREELKEAK